MSELVGDGSVGEIRIRVRQTLDRLNQSFFFIPSLMTIAAIILSQILVGVDRSIGDDSLPSWLGSTVESARSILSAVAGGTITAASVVFSLTLVAVQVAGSQFSPRALRGIFEDRFQKLVMGIVVGTFSYSLFVLRDVRTVSIDDDRAFIPQLSVSVGLLLAMLSILSLLASIDHTAKSLQVGTIADRILDDTMRTIERNFSSRANDEKTSMLVNAPSTAPSRPLPTDRGVSQPPINARAVSADSSGWITQISVRELLRSLPELGRAIIVAPVGTYVSAGMPLCHVWPVQDADIERVEDDIRDAFAIGKNRTMQQDVGFGLLQLNDIALRALSPGVNDPGTAEDVIVRQGEIITKLYGRDLGPSSVNVDGKEVFRSTDVIYDDYVHLAFDPLRHYARESPSVLAVMARTLGEIADSIERSFTGTDLTPIDRQLELMSDELHAIPSEHDRLRVGRAIESARQLVPGSN